MRRVVTNLALASLLVASPIMASSDHDNQQVVSLQIITQVIVLNKQDVRSAKLVEGADNNYSVDISLKSQAAKRLAQLTESNIHRQLMITIGNHIINKATIQSKLGARFQISSRSKAMAQAVIKALS